MVCAADARDTDTVARGARLSCQGTFCRRNPALADDHAVAHCRGGSAYGRISGTLLLPRDPLREVIVAMSFVGTSAAGIGSQAPVRQGYAALLIPFVLPYAINQLLMGGDRIVLGLGFLVYIPVMLIIANRQTKSIEQQIRLALENESLAAELRRERDRTGRVNSELQQQIEEQRRSAQRIRSLNRHLQAQTAELLAANKDLEGFSYSVSHDLRGPLRAIDGFSSLLRDELAAHGEDQATHYLGAHSRQHRAHVHTD